MPLYPSCTLHGLLPSEHDRDSHGTMAGPLDGFKALQTLPHYPSCSPPQAQLPILSGTPSIPSVTYMAPSTVRLRDSLVPLKKAKLDQRLTTITKHVLPSGLVILKRSETPPDPHPPPTIPIPILPWQGRPRPWDDHLIVPTPTWGL